MTHARSDRATFWQIDVNLSHVFGNGTTDVFCEAFVLSGRDEYGYYADGSDAARLSNALPMSSAHAWRHSALSVVAARPTAHVPRSRSNLD